MKILRQIGIILAITFLAQLMNHLIPLPIPASIYGLFIMLALLMSGLLKLEQVKEVGNFMLEIMPLLFIPAAVGFIVIVGDIKEVMIPFVVITILTTLSVMIVTGRVAQFFVTKKKVTK